MSTAVLEEIIEKIELLSEAEQEKVAEVIKQQKQMKAEAERRAFIRSLRGKYAFVRQAVKILRKESRKKSSWKTGEVGAIKNDLYS